MTITIPPSELIAVNELKVDGNNPNQMTPQQHKALSESMTRYGFIVPIITNKDLLIADGEQRWTVAKSLGMTEVPVIRLPVEDVDRRLLRQVLNKLRGEHDLLLDAHEFDKIIEAGHEQDLKQLLLLTDSQIERYLTEIREPKEESYEIPEIEKIQTTIKRGDVYLLGKHRLMCGDATNDCDVLLSDAQPNLLLTDPPYGISIVSSQNSVGISAPVSFGKVGTKGLVEAPVYAPVYADDKPFDPKPILAYGLNQVLFGANNYADKLPPNSHWLIWDKKAEIGADRNFFSDAELLWTNIPRKSCVIYRWLWSGLLRAGSRTVELQKRVHPTQKPVGLLRQIIRDYSKENETVLDPYGGSGSTLIACEQTNRVCYMMEIEPRYCEIIARRWESYTQQKRQKINNENLNITQSCPQNLQPTTTTTTNATKSA